MFVNTNSKQNIFTKAHDAIRLKGKETLILQLLPNGRKRGNEYQALNPRRNDKNIGSFSVNTVTGKWIDFASGDHGGDVISLYAFCNGLSQYEAACEIVGVRPRNHGGL